MKRRPIMNICISRPLLASLGFSLLLSGGLILFGLQAQAQDRPTLERIEATICAQAEEDGDSYLPVFCGTPSCECLNGADLAQAVTCAETSPGVVDVAGTLSASPDAVCTGLCSLGEAACLDSVVCGLTDQGICEFSVQSPCVVILGSCTNSFECDQSRGFSCQGNVCSRPDPCSSPGVCATGLQTSAVRAVFGFAPSGDVSPLQCSSIAGNISSTDVEVCIAEVEAHLGVGACVICGDGNVDPGEQCDDGNLTPGDDCAVDCTNE